MMGLTRKQLELFRFLAAHLRVDPVAPTADDMAVAMGLKSKSGITRLLDGLEERGLIRRIHGKARAIEIIAYQNTIGIVLTPEIEREVDRYASVHGIKRDTAVNELLRQSLGAA